MTSSRKAIPRWFKLACCAVPLAALLVATIGVAAGATVSPIVFLTLTPLSWRVISKVLGIRHQPIVINLPARQTQRRDAVMQR